MRFARGHMSRLVSFVIAVKITPLERESEREKRKQQIAERERDSILECFDIIFNKQWFYWKMLGFKWGKWSCG